MNIFTSSIFSIVHIYHQIITIKHLDDALFDGTQALYISSYNSEIIVENNCTSIEALGTNHIFCQGETSLFFHTASVPFDIFTSSESTLSFDRPTELAGLQTDASGRFLIDSLFDIRLGSITEKVAVSSKYNITMRVEKADFKDGVNFSADFENVRLIFADTISYGQNVSGIARATAEPGVELLWTTPLDGAAPLVLEGGSGVSSLSVNVTLDPMDFDSMASRVGRCFEAVCAPDLDCNGTGLSFPPDTPFGSRGSVLSPFCRAGGGGSLCLGVCVTDFPYKIRPVVVVSAFGETLVKNYILMLDEADIANTSLWLSALTTQAIINLDTELLFDIGSLQYLPPLQIYGKGLLNVSISSRTSGIPSLNFSEGVLVLHSSDGCRNLSCGELILGSSLVIPREAFGGFCLTGSRRVFMHFTHLWNVSVEDVGALELIVDHVMAIRLTTRSGEWLFEDSNHAPTRVTERNVSLVYARSIQITLRIREGGRPSPVRIRSSPSSPPPNLIVRIADDSFDDGSDAPLIINDEAPIMRIDAHPGRVPIDIGGVESIALNVSGEAVLPGFTMRSEHIDIQIASPDGVASIGRIIAGGNRQIVCAGADVALKVVTINGLKVLEGGTFLVQNAAIAGSVEVGSSSRLTLTQVECSRAGLTVDEGGELAFGQGDQWLPPAEIVVKTDTNRSAGFRATVIRTASPPEDVLPLVSLEPESYEIGGSRIVVRAAIDGQTIVVIHENKTLFRGAKMWAIICTVCALVLIGIIIIIWRVRQKKANLSRFFIDSNLIAYEEEDKSDSF